MSWTLGLGKIPKMIDPDRSVPTVSTRELLVHHEFYDAVVSGDLERVKEAITPDLDLETLFGNGGDAYTALHLSVSHLDIFGFLLALGADPFSLSWPGHQQPFHRAAAYGIFEVVQLLLNMGAEVNSTFGNNNLDYPLPASTALWIALDMNGSLTGGDSQNWTTTIDILVSCGAEFPPTTAVYNWCTQSYFEPKDFIPPLHLKEDTYFLMALRSKSKVLWKTYLERRRRLLPLPDGTSCAVSGLIPPNERRIIEGFGRGDTWCSALQATAWSIGDKLSPEWKQERLEIARILLDCHDQRGPWGDSLKCALNNFSANGNLMHMELMLGRGADPDALRKAILAACRSLSTQPTTTRAVIELLVKHGGTFDGRVKDPSYYELPRFQRRFAPGNTCLHQWAHRRDLETLQYLLDTGADVNATNDLGETVLMVFASMMPGVLRGAYHRAQNTYPSFKTLIEAGHRIDSRDKQGRTLLHHFANSIYSVARRRSKEDTPEVISAIEAAVPCLELLVSLGADPGIEDDEGKKPVDWLLKLAPEKRECIGADLVRFFDLEVHDQDRDGSEET